MDFSSSIKMNSNEVSIGVTCDHLEDTTALFGVPNRNNRYKPVATQMLDVNGWHQTHHWQKIPLRRDT